MKDTLSQDSFTTRGRPPGGERRDGLSLFAFVFSACALLVFSRLDLEPVRWLRWQLIGMTAPVLELASAPIGHARQAGAWVQTYVEALSEIERLRLENQRLRSFEWRAKELERKLRQASALARMTSDIGMEFVTARVVADARGPFTNSVIINIGSRDGVRTGFAAVDGDGLVGHVVDVGERAARVLLLRDPSSRIPVRVGAGTRAILNGDGSATPHLTHLGGPLPAVTALPSADATPPVVARGDDVATSGDDGLLPPGLRIGTVVLSEDGPRVRLASSMRSLEYLGILMFHPPTVARGAEDSQLAGETVVRGKLEPTSGRRRPGAPEWPSP